MSYSKYKYNESCICNPDHKNIEKSPDQFCDYMSCISNRFTEICNIYLDGLCLDDVCHLKPEDFINLVPENQYRHKLLMTIMVRRYLCNSENLHKCCQNKKSSDHNYCSDKDSDYHDVDNCSKS